jgi:hypothetical protein
MQTSVHTGIYVSTRYEAECFDHWHGDGTRCTISPNSLCPRFHETRLKWKDGFDNIVVTVGLNRLLSAALRGTLVGGPTDHTFDGLRCPTKWVVSQAYVIGDQVRPSGGNARDPDNRFYTCIVAGTSNTTTEPTWNNTVGGNTAETAPSPPTWQEGSVWWCGLKGTGTMLAADTMASHGSWSEISSSYSDATRQIITLSAPAAGSTDNSASKAVFNINATDTIFGAFCTNVKTKGGTAGQLYGGGDFASSRAVLSGDTLNVQLTATVS